MTRPMKGETWKNSLGERVIVFSDDRGVLFEDEKFGDRWWLGLDDFMVTLKYELKVPHED